MIGEPPAVTWSQESVVLMYQPYQLAAFAVQPEVAGPAEQHHEFLKSRVLIGPNQVKHPAPACYLGSFALRMLDLRLEESCQARAAGGKLRGALRAQPLREEVPPNVVVQSPAVGLGGHEGKLRKVCAALLDLTPLDPRREGLQNVGVEPVRDRTQPEQPGALGVHVLEQQLRAGTGLYLPGTLHAALELSEQVGRVAHCLVIFSFIATKASTPSA